jgi:hypothetical protein
VGADVPDVLDRGVEPLRGQPAPFRGHRVEGPLRAPAGFDRVLGQQPGIQQPGDRAVDDRPGDLPDPAQVTAGRGEPGDGEAVRRPLAQYRQDGPFRQRQ